MTDQSDEQFNELAAHLIARATKALSVSDAFPPMTLALDSGGHVVPAVGVVNEDADFGPVVEALRADLIDLAKDGAIVACCIAFANYAEGCLVALMENSENYCCEIRLPVVNDGGGWRVAADRLEVADGKIYVFPIVADT